MDNGTTEPAPPGPGRHRRGPWRWRIVVGAVAVVAAVAVFVATRALGGGAACAAGVPAVAPQTAVPVAGQTYSGRSTFYAWNQGPDPGGDGNCSYPTHPTYYVAMPPPWYAAGAACGATMDVTGPRGTVRVTVVDSCPDCEAGHIDLSPEAFARIADPAAGSTKMTLTGVRNPMPAKDLSFKVKEGSQQWWLALLPIDHGNPLASVELKTGGGWRSMSRSDYGYWIAENAGTGPFTVRLTDVYGAQATATGIRLAAGQVQHTGTRLYGGPAPAPTAPAASSPAASPSPPASPSATATSVPPTDPASLPPAAVPVSHRCGDRSS